MMVSKLSDSAIAALDLEQLEAKIYNLLGFAQKAGKIVSGDDSVFIALVKKRLPMIIIASDISENTKDKFLQKQASAKSNKNNHGRDIPNYIFGTKGRLGIAIGKSPRGLVAVTDENFSQGLKGYLEAYVTKQAKDSAK